MISLLDDKEKRELKTTLFQIIFFVGAENFREYLSNIPKLETNNEYKFYDISFIS